MKLQKSLLALLLCTALLLSLAGCQTKPAPTEPTAPPTEPTDPPAPSAQELYAQAVADFESNSYVELKANITRTSTVGSDVYTKTAEQKLTWKDWTADTMQAKVTETSAIGENTTRASEVYRDGTVYQVIDDLPFYSEMTAEDFTSRWVSVIPLDESLYESLTAEETGDGTTIHFETASAPERWAAPEHAQLHAASGTALLDAEGTLTGFTYSASFTQGGAKVELSAQISVSVPTAVDLTLDIPATDERYVFIDTPDITRLLTDAYGYLSVFSSATSTHIDSMYSEVLGGACSIAVDLAAYGGKSDHMSTVNQTVMYAFYDGDESYDSEIHTYTQSFKDGVYSTATDDGEPEASDSSITADSMYAYCLQHLNSSYPYLSEITDATITDFGGICLIEMDCSNELAYGYSRYLCDFLTDDANLIDKLAAGYKTTAMDYYYAINLDTGLPTACGVNFSGVHTIDGVPYNMSYQSSQSFYISDPGAYELLTGEVLPEEEPAEKATPLFYHVTGDGGQEMWLMGTIHLGDARTAYLPQEIYDALDSSNALAVEFDDENFEQLLDDDPTLLNRLLTTYYYTDGTMTVDHLDPMLYAASAKLLKATGNAQEQVMMMKPYLWSQLIDSFYIDQGYGLNYDKGVDARLMERARSKEITILNVESGIEQAEMISGFSDAIQELLLGSSVYMPSYEVYQSTLDLFELWCEGDEAALIAYLADDTSDMSPQELALYNEYNKAMMTDRNAGMLEVAKEYLESGDVVFYAVGLAHLLAEDGLVNTLREAGYTVELVSYGE